MSSGNQVNNDLFSSINISQNLYSKILPDLFILLWQETPSSSFEYQKQGGEECHFTNNILVLEVLIGFEVGINTLKSTYM